MILTRIYKSCPHVQVACSIGVGMLDCGVGEIKHSGLMGMTEIGGHAGGNKHNHTYFAKSLGPFSVNNAQLPHSYYFTTCILVLKFVNKGVFFEEIQYLHFHRKRGYLGTHLHEFGEKGVIFMSSVLL